VSRLQLQNIGPARVQNVGNQKRMKPWFYALSWLSRQKLASLADGDSAEEILADSPALKAEDIRAAIAFAAASAEEDLPVPEVPHIR